MSLPQKSATPHSQTSEETSEPPRRSQRAQLPKKAEVLKDDMDGEDEAVIDAEEEEITRCVCGQQDYPGPPLSEAFDNIDPHAEDPGGLFISCDGCSVWQHGGCVGILEDAQVPEQYYCEECRPKLHEVQIDTRGYVLLQQTLAHHVIFFDPACRSFLMGALPRTAHMHRLEWQPRCSMLLMHHVELPLSIPFTTQALLLMGAHLS